MTELKFHPDAFSLVEPPVAMKTRAELIQDIQEDLWRPEDIADLLIRINALEVELAAARNHLTEVMSIAPDTEQRMAAANWLANWDGKRL